ncbi:centlein [Chanos chanos]|uniref:Centlein n=1 Tax=Chanos chanos TaxID=29144 RepID=A0A6J2WLH6_CHACN|nr:centlein-like [Chanos chanos]
MASKDNGRILHLEEQVRSLSEELVQCQADKEFVWTLWKRLQVANPDLTQAVSLVVEREKQKAEVKDRKVLEILQAKDYKIQELEQRVTEQQREINNLAQGRRGGEEEQERLKKELAALHQKLGNKSRQVKELKERSEREEEQEKRVAAALEEARQGLESRCSALQADLKRAQEQEAEWRQQVSANCSKVKELEEALSKVRLTVFETQSHSAAVSAQLSSTERELTHRDEQIHSLRRELEELQALYRQSVEHAGEQAQLIQQLEGLNLDTQKVLRSQEAAHTADTSSYQKLYSELSVSYQALQRSEAELRQRTTVLTAQLHQKDQQLQQLHTQLQQQQQQQQTAACSPQAKPSSSQPCEDFPPAAVLDSFLTGQHTLIKSTLDDVRITRQVPEANHTAGPRGQSHGRSQRLRRVEVNVQGWAGVGMVNVQGWAGVGMVNVQGWAGVGMVNVQGWAGVGMVNVQGWAGVGMVNVQGWAGVGMVNVQGWAGVGVQQQRLEQVEREQQTKACASNLDLQPTAVTPTRSELLPAEPPDSTTGLRSSARGPDRRKSAPTLRSRSLSPSSSECSGTVRGVEKRIQQLQELLTLKTEENEELRRAHAKRHDRLRLIQTNYRTVKEQLKEAGDAQGRPRGKGPRRAEPWQLRQEDSDGVWNELAFFKKQNKKLLIEKANLEEELDLLRVQAAMDRATAHELRMNLEEDRLDLLHMEAEQNKVKSSTPVQTSAQRVEQSFKKIAQLEQKMVSLEKETTQLRLENQEIQENNEALAEERDRLRADLQRLRAQGAAREEALQAQVQVERERHQGETQALQAQLRASRKQTEEARREAAQAGQRLLSLRQEMGVLRAQRDFHKAAAKRRAKGPVSANSKVRRMATWSRAPLPQQKRQVYPHMQQGRTESPAIDDWEDMSVDSDSEFSDSLESHRPVRNQHTRPASATKGRRYKVISPLGVSTEDFNVLQLPQPQSQGEEEQDKKARKRRARKAHRNSACALLRQRVLSLQQQVCVLQADKKAAQQVARDQKQNNERIQAQLDALAQKLHGSKLLSQKQAAELAGLEQQKVVLEMELEQWRKIRPVQEQQRMTPDPALTPDPNSPAVKQLEAEVKQLQSKLKNAINETTKHSAANKSLKSELNDREQKLKELQERASLCERDVVMKRQLVEDLRSRLKVLQDAERNQRSLIEDLEKKVKSLTEEASNRKAFIESLKRRLSVATKEKSQHESSCQKLKEDLDRKEQKVSALQARVAECEKAMAELEQTASAQMHSLAQQSSQSLDSVNSKLSLAHSQLEQLRSFTQALAGEMVREVQETKAQLRKRRRTKRRKISAGPSKNSMARAQSIAASILNMTETDLADMLDTDEVREPCSDDAQDREWLERVIKILQQQIPSAALLMDAMVLKMKEKKVLTEELAVLRAVVSENP